MKEGLSKFGILLLMTFLSGCSSLQKLKEIKIPNLKSSQVKQTVTINKTIAISCQKGDIQEYIDEGWVIKNQKSQEVVCSWKAEKAKKNCNIDKDKGCKITVPDRIGEQIIYYLEKKSSIK